MGFAPETPSGGLRAPLNPCGGQRPLVLREWQNSEEIKFFARAHGCRQRVKRFWLLFLKRVARAGTSRVMAGRKNMVFRPRSWLSPESEKVLLTFP